MRTFAQKQSQPQEQVSSGVVRSNKLTSAPNHHVPPVPHLQRTIGSQPAPGTRQTPAAELGADSTSAPASYFAHDFSRIPLHAPAAGAIQTKLTINQPGDIYEQEADRIADQVLGTPAHPAISVTPPSIQRFSEPLTGQSKGQLSTAPRSVDQVLASPGSPLEPALRQDMEQRFGHDFSRVRVHSDPAAAHSAREVNANAYTVGYNIVFGAGRFAPGTNEGRHLLAHELTHIVQQNREQSRRQHQTETGLTGPLVQRDVTRDIPVGSADFWTHLRTRAFIRLVAWIADSRQKLNEFVEIMGDTNKPSPWGGVAVSWIALFIGPPQSFIFRALFATAQALLAKVASDSTLFEFRNTLEHNFDALSVQVNDLTSDLPIYEALRQAEAKANVGRQEERPANRESARNDLEQALNALPSPDRLKQALLQRWLSTVGRTESDVTTYYETSYRVVENTTDPPSYAVTEIEGTHKPLLLHAHRPEQTIKALRNAYTNSAPLHTLSLPMTIKFWVYSEGKSGPLGGTRSFLWKHDPILKIWAPGKGLGSEEEDAVFRDWYDRGFKPTVGILEKGFAE
jgi:hypothetical protein